MIFTDPAFLFVFLPAICAIFLLVTARFGRTAGLAVIFAGSVLFYAPWGWSNVLILLASVTLNFVAGQMLLSLKDERRRLRMAVLAGGELYNFAALIWFKYHFVQKLLSMGDERISVAALAIPVGISFYTFHQAAFLADAYRRDASVVAYMGRAVTLVERLGAFVRYGAFVTFFPQLVIGPITYLKEFEPQTRAGSSFGRFRQSNLAVGLMLMAIGMFKKLVIADNLAGLADPVFDAAGDASAINAISAWIGVFAYYCQLYFDFSGYSDMALGIARLFGVRFPINFYSPLKSVGIVDFYRRWHMTLTRVISRFLFTPLSLMGTRYAAARRLPKGPMRLLSLWLPLIVNFEVIGLWHGAAATFVAFGLIHGAWYALETEVRATKRWKAWRKASPDWLRLLLGRMIFLLPMSLTFALFRSESLPAAWHLLTQLNPLNLDAERTSSALRGATWLLGAFFVIFALPNSVQLLRRWRPGLMTFSHPPGVAAEGFWSRQVARLRWRPNWLWSGIWLGMVLTSLYFVTRQPPFLYQGF